MSLPKFDVQGSLFESLGSIAPDLFDDDDIYKLFARKIWPVLAARREELAQCYAPKNGRPGIEPVVLLGVLIFQFLERVPDRQAAELVKYHLGWKLALDLKLGAEGFHPTSLVHFRQRLLENGKSDLALRAVLGALKEEGFIAKSPKQRLDSTHIVGAVARLSALECVRETLALALEEAAEQIIRGWTTGLLGTALGTLYREQASLQKYRRAVAIQTPPSWRRLLAALEVARAVERRSSPGQGSGSITRGFRSTI